MKLAWLLTAVLCGATPAAADPFTDLLRTLVETDTTLTSGSCTLATDRVTELMVASGFPRADIHAYAAPDHPTEGGLVAVLPGSDARAKALLLVAHIDVVEAKAADWATPPFTLTEADGYYRGRGVSDNKGVAAILIDSLVRLHREAFRPKRSIKVALTCGEETASAFNGAHYLATERRALIEAGLALVPSGGGQSDAAGQPLAITVQAGEKLQQGFRIEAHGIGSHASRPTKANAITSLAAALVKLGAYEFPATLNPVTRAYFALTATRANAADAAAIHALLADPANRPAQKLVSLRPEWNAMLRTTCAATMIEAGTQANTIAPRAAATLNCRLLPGASVDDVLATLTRITADPAISVTTLPPLGHPIASPPLTQTLLGPIAAQAQQQWPGVTLIPAMLTGATDARHFNAIDIPAYGVTALFYDADGNGVHAANERIGVHALNDGRAFLYALIKRFSAAL